MSSEGTPSNSATETGDSSTSALTDGGIAEFFTPEPSQPAVAAEGAAKPAQPAAPAGTVPPVQPAAPAAVPVPAVAAPAPVQSDPQLSETLTSLRDAITNMGKKPGEETAPAADPLTAIPAYEITLPPQVMEQLNAPEMEIRSKALGAVISATMKTVHQQVFTQMMQHIANLRAEIPMLAQNVVAERQTREEVSKDFYGNYKEYDTPLLRPVVQLAVVEVAKANPELVKEGRWTPALRDAVGAYMRKNVPLGITPAATILPKAPAAPPALMGSGTRPGGDPLLTGQEAALAEMFD